MSGNARVKVLCADEQLTSGSGLCRGDMLWCHCLSVPKAVVPGRSQRLIQQAYA